MKKSFVPPTGPRDAKIVIIGEQPGKTEAFYSHVPFTGSSGKLLDECLQAAKLDRRAIYLTNVIKDLDAPLEHYFTSHGSGEKRYGTFSSEGQEYLEMLKEELGQLSPNVVVCCGNVSLYALTNRIGITNWRGSILPSSLISGVKCIGTFHPATWTEEKLRKNEAAYLNKYIVIMDLEKAKREGAFPEIRTTNRVLKIAPSYLDVLQFLTECHIALHSGRTIDYDIELVPGTKELSCIGLAISPTYAMCIPFVGPEGDYFTLEQETALMIEIAALLERKGTFRGQNIIFDSHLLFRKFGIITRSKHDTMVAQKIRYGDFAGSVDPTTGIPRGNSLRGGSLQFITAMWTDIPYYKQDGKQFLTGITNWDRAWEYNALDTVATATAHPLQLQELQLQGNLRAYERQIALIEPLTYMMEHGIKIDVEGMIQAKESNRVRLSALEKEIYSYTGEINLNSSQQLQEYFYGKLRISPYTKDGKPTVDVNALKRLGAQHKRVEATLLLEYRRLFKQNSTFLDPTVVDSDGRIRCSYNPVGTKFSRISSSRNIFGTGMNLQQIPHEVLTYFVADEGYVVYELDYSQYENRLVAYRGNIPQMMAAFENNLDLHSLTAALVLTMLGRPTDYYEVSRDERQDYGKRPNHAFNYGLGPGLFSLLHELPLATGKSIYAAYHSAYPNLQRGYWKYVQANLRANRTLQNFMGRRYTFLGKWGDSLLQEAYSYIPQSTCGDCLNERGIIFTYYNEDFKEVELLTQVHDSMSLQIPLSVPWHRHAEILIAIKRSMEIPLDCDGREILTPVDLVVNNNLNKEIGIEIQSNPKPGKPKFVENVEELSLTLCSAWEKLSHGN
jgi:uracil-DNA glycosylase family 4